MDPIDWPKLLDEALARRAKLAMRTDAYRVLNGIGDGVEGVTLDRYADHWQLQYFSSHHQGAELELCQAIIAAFRPRLLVVKERLSPSGKSLEHPTMRVVHGDATQSKTVVIEGGCKFHIDLLDTVNPGLFLDMREHRLALAPMARGGELLNLFCYTGSFSVHARYAGATRAVNVDVSAKILERVRENYAANGIAPVKGEFFRGDSEEYLRYALRKGLRFKAVVLDPPSFSRADGAVFQVRQHLGELARLCAQVTEPGGHLLVSSNHSDFTPESLAALVDDWLADLEQGHEVLWTRSQAEDFPASGTRRESCLSAALLRMQ